jgi:asparagine synthase (glutamine-hydrolysing)
MCGIAGWLGSLPQGSKHAALITQALHHRGPDANGTHTWPEATLIHTRLSILDLSPTGAQPMSNADGTVWTVFNGEIYNHHELRRELENRGHVLKGRSDTEVLPLLYEEHGAEFVRKLRGMFSLAIYDVRKRSLLLARDRFGIKPLFYAALPDRIMFASEIKALKTLPGVDRRPNPQAISDFAALCFIPGPDTFFAGIRTLQPGEVLQARYESGAVSHKISTYNKWVLAPDLTMTMAMAEERTRELLETAIRSQLESDVPLAALLSGGIDSSLVSVAAQKSLSGQLQTFNVRFADQAYDETWAALQVADHIGSRHQTLDMDGTPGSWDYIIGLLEHAGQPFADTSLFAVHAVCRLMRQRVTVALSGDGGDEGFGGYAVYQRLGAISHWQRLPKPVSTGLSWALAALSHVGGVAERLPERLNKLSRANDAASMQILMCWVREDEHKRLCRMTDVLPVGRLFEPQWDYDLPRNASHLERFSAHATELHSRLFLANDFLFKVDIASMREGLEVRVPMLNEELFAFGLSLPHRLKATAGTSKRVLRSLARRWLPPAVAGKRKQGFEVPVDRWVDSSFRLRVKDALLCSSSPLPEYLRPDAYRPIVEAFCNGSSVPGVSRQGLYQRTIMLLGLHMALREAC